jgi:hypothetical protein
MARSSKRKTSAPGTAHAFGTSHAVERQRPAERRIVARDVRPDSRKRISLGPALKDLEGASFTVYIEPTGRIVLEPQVSVPASEAWLFRNKGALESLRQGFEDVAAGKTRSLGSFAEYADDDEA